MDMRMTKSVSKGSVNGPSKSGGTNSHTFVKDGGISYLGQLPTWVFTLSVHLARPSQTCWSIPHPFRSLLITRKMTTSLQKMKREYSSLSSNVIVSAASAFDCVLQY